VNFPEVKRAEGVLQELWSGFARLFRPRYAPTASRGRLANLGHPSGS
jgi:hypothetical protein